jgi:hypothetical protein
MSHAQWVLVHHCMRKKGDFSDTDRMVKADRISASYVGILGMRGQVVVAFDAQHCCYDCLGPEMPP